MQLYKILILASAILTGCNESATTPEKNETDTTAKISTADTTSQPLYDPAMDGLLVGAAFAKKLGDTLNVKMYELTLKPGDSATIHRHPDHAVYVLQGGKLLVNFEGKGSTIMDLPTGAGFISGPVGDAAKNIGKTTIRLLLVDIYRPLGKQKIN